MKPLQNYQIAIDGPAGSGKSTIAKLLAKKLSVLYIDSGSMYRAITLYLINRQLLDLEEHFLKKQLKKIKIDFQLKNNNQRILLNNIDVTEKIRTSQVNKNVSKISAIGVVRKELVERQQQFAEVSSLVMDGRDIGTAVFPNAKIKIYLTASSLVRAKRRKQDLQKIGEKISIKELIKQIECRDYLDSSRAISPLVKAQDAILIDTSELNINEVINQITLLIPKEN